MNYSFNLLNNGTGFMDSCEQITIEFCQRFNHVLTTPLYVAIGIMVFRILLFNFMKNANSKLLSIIDFGVDVSVITLIAISLAWSYQ